MGLTTTEYQQHVQYATSLVRQRFPTASLQPAELVHHAWEKIATRGEAICKQQWQKEICTALYALVQPTGNHLVYNESWQHKTKPIEMRVCAGCGESLPCSAFYQSLSSKGVLWRDGLCKPCRKNHKKQYYQQHKERIVSRTMAYHKAHPAVKKLSALKTQQQRCVTAPAVCVTCQQELPPEAFYTLQHQVGTLRWLSDQCKPCSRKKARRYYQQHREQVLAKQRRYQVNRKENAAVSPDDHSVSMITRYVENTIGT